MDGNITFSFGVFLPKPDLIPLKIPYCFIFGLNRNGFFGTSLRASLSITIWSTVRQLPSVSGLAERHKQFFLFRYTYGYIGTAVDL